MVYAHCSIVCHVPLYAHCKSGICPDCSIFSEKNMIPTWKLGVIIENVYESECFSLWHHNFRFSWDGQNLVSAFSLLSKTSDRCHKKPKAMVCKEVGSGQPHVLPEKSSQTPLGHGGLKGCTGQTLAKDPNPPEATCGQVSPWSLSIGGCGPQWVSHGYGPMHHKEQAGVCNLAQWMYISPWADLDEFCCNVAY